MQVIFIFLAIEISIKMSEILNFWLSLLALISQMPPYLVFILVSKSTHSVSFVLSSHNPQCFYISTPLFAFVKLWYIINSLISVKSLFINFSRILKFLTIKFRHLTTKSEFFNADFKSHRENRS